MSDMRRAVRLSDVRQIVVPLHAEKREARGRNGWFKPACFQLFRMEALQQIWLEVRSARSHGAAPIHIETDPADIYQLGVACLRAAQAAGFQPTEAQYATDLAGVFDRDRGAR